MMSKKTFSRLSAAILLLLTISTPAGAQEISVEAARQTAAKFINEHAAKLPAKSRKGMMKAPPKAESLQLVYTQEDQLHESPALYVFEQPKQGGFVIASADERAYPILGYNEIGTFREDSLPCCLKFILEEYGKQIAEARTQNLPRHTEKTENESWQNIEPLISCAWSQDAPFNNLCPIDKYTGERCVTGCVATAMAQIMYYWKWPERGVGSHSYQTNNVEGTLTANFGETTYRWDLMKDKYKWKFDDNGIIYYDDPENAVATLMYHCGVALNMHYSSSGSGAGSIERPLKEYFNYSHAISSIECDFENKFYDELSHGRPVEVSGSMDDDNHAYVCDGYRTDGFFHFNFGWGSTSVGNIGYYKIYAVNTGTTQFSPEFWNGYKTRSATIRIAPKSEDILDSNGNVYEQLDGEAFLVNARNAEGHLEIPSHVTSSNGTAYPVTGISGTAVNGNVNITSVTIPNTVTAIGAHTFINCRKLTSVIIPNSVKSIDEWAFYDTPALSSIKIYNTNPSAIILGDGAFDRIKEDCILYVPKGCAEKYREANAEWRKFTNIVDNLDVEGDDDDGSVITQDRITYKIGSGKVSIIRSEVSSDIVIPASITDKGGNRYTVTDIQDGAFLENYDITSVVLPNTITTIGYRAFSRCKNLTSITIPNSVTNIKSGAFLGCINLSSIVIPNSITTIEDQTFMGCFGLTSVTIPNSVTEIGPDAFSYSGLTSVTIPNSVTEIGPDAFDRCSGLTSMTSYIENPFAINAFYGIPSNATLYVPKGTSEKYKSTDGWKNFKNIVEIETTGIEGVFSEGDNRETKATNPWYSVDGVKLNGEPKKKGIYIYNRKKVVK